MRRSLFAAAAAATLLSALAVDAEAMTAPRFVTHDEASAVTPVVGRCGWHRIWSPRYQRCVWFRRD